MSSEPNPFVSAHIELRRADGSTWIVDLVPSDGQSSLEGSLSTENEARELTPEETDFSSWRPWTPTGRRFVDLAVKGRATKIELTLPEATDG